MKTKRLKKILCLVSMATIVPFGSASAHKWCHNGTIVQIGDVNWNESVIIANYPGIVPDDIPDWVFDNIDHHIAYEAKKNYADSFVGGGGALGGFVAANSGEVRTSVYAPSNYITAPSLYNISEGIQFKLHKCYTIPPMTQLETLYEIDMPWKPTPGVSNPVVIAPMNGVDGVRQYWIDNSSNSQ